MVAEVLVLYYSRQGSVTNLANQIALGIESGGAKAKLRAIAPLNQTVMDGQDEALYATLEDLYSCDALAFGSPTRFGMMASAAKHFWEQTSELWLKGTLIDKPACVFTSSASMHGGNEATLLNLATPLLHHGMMLLGVPYDVPELNATQSGGTPYGASHVAGLDNQTKLTDDEKRISRALGQRLAKIAIRLKSSD